MSLDRGRFGGDAPDHEIAVGPQTKIERVPDPSREQHHAGNLVVQRALAEEGPRICPFAAVDEADAILAERGGDRAAASQNARRGGRLGVDGDITN